MAVLPSVDSATELPWRLVPAPPLPTSLPPCCGHTPPLRVDNPAAPPDLLPPGAPTMAVLPPEESATEKPCWALFPAAPVPTSLGPCWVHTPPLRVNTHTAPAWVLSNAPPTMAVLPSAETAT